MSLLPQVDISPALFTFCLRHKIAPLSMDATILSIAVERSLSDSLVTELMFICERSIRMEYWPIARLNDAMYRLQQQKPNRSLHDVAADCRALKEQQNEFLSKSSDDEPIVRFVSQILQQAIQHRASDIHFEPDIDCYRIRFRIDGVLQAMNTAPAILAARIVARLKVMAQLNIAEHRLPQDGQLTVQLDSKNYMMRLSSLPISTGEKIVLRVVASDQQPLMVNELGMSIEQQKNYQQALALPQGLLLATGPTGSGKTVTLYSGLNVLNKQQLNICSVEDPIEVEVAGINQTQVNSKSGLSFSRALRAFLRQDPDVIMVGEIRDRETADIALTAAQTGHLVLSTLHTNSTIDTLIRLTQMGIPNYLLAGSLTLIIAQRLLRQLCIHCRQQQEMCTEIQHIEWAGTVKTWVANGCDHCLGGYYGRTGLYEMLYVTTEIKTALIQARSQQELQQLAIKQGTVTLFKAGIKLVEQGVTSLKELYRVLGGDTEEQTYV